MAKLRKISIKINNEQYEISPTMEVNADSVLILPLRSFVGAEHYGATRNVIVDTHITTEAGLRSRGINV